MKSKGINLIIKKKLIICKGIFIHSHTQELAESLVQDSNDNNKDNVKKSHFSLIILKSLMICPFWWALMGVITLKD